MCLIFYNFFYIFLISCILFLGLHYQDTKFNIDITDEGYDLLCTGNTTPMRLYIDCYKEEQLHSVDELLLNKPVHSTHSSVNIYLKD